jgi:hypothetical protein
MASGLMKSAAIVWFFATLLNVYVILVGDERETGAPSTSTPAIE